MSLLGPLLAPENYQTSPIHAPSTSPSYPNAGRTSQSSNHPTPFLYNPNSPAPFDWLHFEGRSVKTTLSNITGLDGLARERKWRSHCVFSVDVGRRGRQGVEAVWSLVIRTECTNSSNANLAHTARRRALPQQALRRNDFCALRRDSSGISAFVNVGSSTTRAACRPLGQGWRSGALDADEGVFSELSLG